ncbi:lysine histidine transporter-like 8 [Punica granatum]|uniref:Uncharacterized protein n=2 Tax=Punica granatum TaxID=22663 RepID=A0A2I0K9M9_PUNGR|nr:lysine histidine transporter-like 8 [Punica granatum]PKI64880.1 hypothetical protein CRG98_014723 [Punica granatum]
MGEAAIDLDLDVYYKDEAGSADNIAEAPLHIVMAMDDYGAELKGEEDPVSHDVSAGNKAQAEPWDARLPLTESRKGNAMKAVFHVVCSGIGVQTLLLPVALATLGWTWGILILTAAFAWQLYTIWILVHLHESPSGIRYSRYLQLTIHAFGPKLGKLLGIFPVMYLSGGTCVMLIITGGGAMRTLFRIIACGDAATCHAVSLTGAEWFLVFTCIAIAVAQLPNLNSIAGVSLIGAITGVAYCTIIWVLAVQEGHAGSLSHEPLVLAAGKSGWARAGDALNAVGIIALAFRGHNLILEIQGTLPSSPKEPSKGPMWKAVMISYSLISLCFYPLAIAGFWASGNNVIIPSGGMLRAISNSDRQHVSKFLLGLILVLVILNSLCVFQIYAMPVFDNFEIRYTSITGKRWCNLSARTCLRLLFGLLAYLISVAFPFLGSLAPLIGGLTSPLTFAYPCLMWVRIRKPQRASATWWFNSVIGCLGLILSAFLVAAALWNLIDKGLDANFFKP